MNAPYIWARSVTMLNGRSVYVGGEVRHVGSEDHAAPGAVLLYPDDLQLGRNVLRSRCTRSRVSPPRYCRRSGVREVVAHEYVFRPDYSTKSAASPRIACPEPILWTTKAAAVGNFSQGCQRS